MTKILFQYSMLISQTILLTGNPDPAIGIAQLDCAKDVILGRDSKAWSVYVDSTRSWFQHNNAHLYRSEGG